MNVKIVDTRGHVTRGVRWAGPGYAVSGGVLGMCDPFYGVVVIFQYTISLIFWLLVLFRA